MKFKFNSEVSKMFDYLLFPRLYYSLETTKEYIDDQLIKVMKEEYIDFFKQMHSTLKPYKEAIEKFYHKDIYSNYDFLSILLSAYPIFSYQDIKDYFSDLLTIKPNEFKQNIMQAILTIGENTKDNKVVVNETIMTEYINNLKLSSENKWHLFMITKDPVHQLKQFIELLNQIEPIFLLNYQKYSSSVQSIGKDLVYRLSNDKTKTLQEITQNAITFDFNQKDVCEFYVSFTMPYTVRLINSNIYRIIWGMDMEDAFIKMKELNEDKLIQRVKIFKALGDKTRYETLKLIANGVHSIKKIADQLDVSSATISYHINEFLTSGILFMNRKKEPRYHYQIDYQKLNEVLESLKEDLNC